MNKIKLTGSVACEPTYSHEIYGEKFYKFKLISDRLSGAHDVLPCVISETMVNKVKIGDDVEITGEIRTRNYTDENDKRKCEISVFVDSVKDYDGFHDDNEVTLTGFICKEPNYRETPLGRQICDVLIASNRERNGKSDYVPSVVWGRNALRASQMAVGTKIEVSGRLQSREYIKRYKDDAEETMVAYELSIAKIKECE